MSWYWPNFTVPTALASTADYQNWTGGDSPDNIVQVLRACSRLVLDATSAAYYAVDSTTGLATVPQIANALRDATCIQAAAWVSLGVDPNSGGVISKSGTASSKKIGTAQVIYDNSGSALAAESRAAAYVSLVPEAEQLLRQNNLMGFAPWMLG